MILSIKTSFQNDRIRAGVLWSIPCVVILCVHKKWQQFPPDPWGYSVLGAIIHSAVKESLSAMHTRLVHGVPDQSQNVTELFFHLKHCFLGFIKGHWCQWKQTPQRGRVHFSEVGCTNGGLKKTGMSQWPWHRPHGCSTIGTSQEIVEILQNNTWQSSQHYWTSATLSKPGNTEPTNLKIL